MFYGHKELRSRVPSKIISLRYSKPLELKALDFFFKRQKPIIHYRSVICQKNVVLNQIPLLFEPHPPLTHSYLSTETFGPATKIFTPLIYVTGVLTFDSSCKDFEIRSCPICCVSLGNISNCGSAHPSVRVHLTRHCNDMPVWSYSSRVASARYNSQPTMRSE